MTEPNDTQEPERTHLCAWCNLDTPESELTYDEETDDFYCGSCINLANLAGGSLEEDDEEDEDWGPEPT